jgi:hypothetical protein
MQVADYKGRLKLVSQPSQYALVRVARLVKDRFSELEQGSRSPYDSV